MPAARNMRVVTSRGQETEREREDDRADDEAVRTARATLGRSTLRTMAVLIDWRGYGPRAELTSEKAGARREKYAASRARRVYFAQVCTRRAPCA